MAAFQTPTEWSGTTEGTAAFKILVAGSLCKSIIVQNEDASSNLYVCADAAGTLPIVKLVPGAYWEPPVIGPDLWQSALYAKWDGTPSGTAYVTVVN